MGSRFGVEQAALCQAFSSRVVHVVRCMLHKRRQMTDGFVKCTQRDQKQTAAMSANAAAAAKLTHTHTLSIDFSVCVCVVEIVWNFELNTSTKLSYAVVHITCEPLGVPD